MFRFRFLPRLILRFQSEPSLPLGALAGVRLRAHPSTLFGVAVVVLALDHGIVRRAVSDPGEAVALCLALAGSLLLSLTARAVAGGRAARARSAPGTKPVVTLHLLGASVVAPAPESPRDDGRRAAAGLVTSLGLALGGAAAWIAWAGKPGFGAAAAVAAFLAVSNALIVSIHAFPAFPLDAGRFLRAALWRVGGDRHRATWLAARNSRWFAFAILATGVAALVYGSGVGALLLLVGWFVGESAEGFRVSSREALVRGLAAAASSTALAAPVAPVTRPQSRSPAPPFGPDRAGNRQAKKPRTQSTSKPGTLASAPNDPPVQNADPGD